MTRLPAAHRGHGYRCFLPDLTEFTTPLLRRAQSSRLTTSVFTRGWWNTPPEKTGGGEVGIRTPGTRKGTTDFESAAFDRSATSPRTDIYPWAP